MAFSITFTQRISKTKQIGRIVLDDLDENFVIPTTYWNKEKYENQWRDAVNRITGTKSDINSMLITSFYDPLKANYLQCWPLYKVCNQVYVQNSFIFMDTLHEVMDESNIYKYVPQREIISEDTSDEISEWQVSLVELKEWLLSTNQ